MKNAHFISEQKNKIFLGQRLKALKKKYKLISFDKNKEIKGEDVFLFTWDNKSILKINKFKNLDLLKKITLIEVIHSGHLCSQGFYKNKFKFFLENLKKRVKIYLKLLKFLKKKKYLYNLRVIFSYVVVTSKKKEFKVPIIPCNLVISSKPFYLDSNEYGVKKLKIKKNNNNNFLYYFDSHFPLHPDSCPKITIDKNKKIIKKMLKIYIDFLNRNIFQIYKNYNIVIFLHPRTYDNFKTIKFSAKEKKILGKFTILSGYNDFKKNFNSFNKKDIFLVQYGTQLSLLRSTHLKKKKNIVNLLELDYKFIKDFQYLKKSLKDYKNFFKNYELVEINPFIGADKKKFLKIS